MVYVIRGWSDDHVFNDPELDEGLAAGRLISIQSLPHETHLGWMRGFVAALDDDWPRDALAAALAGPAPGRDFEEALGRFPSERSRWLACRRERLAAVLRAWLEANDIEPDPDQMEG